MKDRTAVPVLVTIQRVSHDCAATDCRKNSQSLSRRFALFAVTFLLHGQI